MIHRPTREQHTDQVYAAILGQRPQVVPPEEIERSRLQNAAARTEELCRAAWERLHAALSHPRLRPILQRVLGCWTEAQGRVLRNWHAETSNTAEKKATT